MEMQNKKFISKTFTIHYNFTSITYYFQFSVSFTGWQVGSTFFMKQFPCSKGTTLVVWWLRFKEAHNYGSAMQVTGTGRKNLCLVQRLAMQCWWALTRVKKLSTAATSLAPKLYMCSWVVQSPCCSLYKYWIT